MMMNGTVQNKIFKDPQMDHIIHNLSIQIGNFLFVLCTTYNVHPQTVTILINLIIFYSVNLDNDLNSIVQKFSEHYHDAWASRKLENGWVYGEQFNDVNKAHPRLKPYMMLSEYVSFNVVLQILVASNYIPIKLYTHSKYLHNSQLSCYNSLKKKKKIITFCGTLLLY